MHVMATKAEVAFEKYQSALGQSEGVGEWYQVTQDTIDAFANLTEDHQFIHVDPKMAAELSPWGVTIAHGFLTLSMLTHLSGSIPQDMSRLDGIMMGVNYGFDKIRFINPVKVNARIRAEATLKSVELRDPSTLQVTRTLTVEIEGETKPALVADWITRMTYA